MDLDIKGASGSVRAAAVQEALGAQIFLALLRLRRPLVTWVLLACIIAVYGLEEFFGGGSVATLVRMGAEVPANVRRGEWWRLLSATFLHSGLPHLLMNGAVLWMLGPFIERLFGSARFLILYVLCGLCGSLLGTFFSKFTLSVGASGALFGLLGASAVLGLWPRGRIPLLLVSELRRTALINLGLNILISLRPNVDYLAHLGGVLAGIALVGLGGLQPAVLPSGQPQPLLPLRRWLLIGMAAFCALALGGSLLTAFWMGKPWELSAPLFMQRQRLGNTGLSMELPTLLGLSQSAQRDDGAIEIHFATKLDVPISLGILIAPIDTGAPGIAADPALRRRIFEQAAASLRNYVPDAHAIRSGEPQEIEIDGFATMAVNYRYGTRGATMQRLLQVREHHIVTLESLMFSDVPKNIRLDLTQLVSSLRQDAQKSSDG